MVRKAQKMGVEAITVSLSDNLIKGVEKIFNETPIRQGKPFKHYGAKFDQIKRGFKDDEKYPYEFICALYKNEIIGLHSLKVFKGNSRNEPNPLDAKTLGQSSKQCLNSKSCGGGVSKRYSIPNLRKNAGEFFRRI